MFLAFLLLLAGSCAASVIDGTVVIKRKLTRSRVTTSANTYQRGTAVPVGPADLNGGLGAEYRRVVVYLEGALPQAEPTTAVLEQKNRQFLPEAVVIPVGSSVSFPNLDPIFHNVFSLSKSKAFDLGNYPQGQTRLVTFSRPGVVFVNCHLHPNMAAAIVVTPNAWFARLDGAGKFQIPQVPAGSYTVVAWHKAAGFFHQKVAVGVDGRVAVDFFIPLEDTGKVAVAQH
ncbi:MAG: hypothetical protein JNK87_27515 [Bryobacterales bacterium]|nr:hypothetical protein [Bryobacterales bacterium]